MNGLAIRKDVWLAPALSGLGLCLFADCTALKGSRILASALAEINAVLADPGTQWMVFVCAAIYFLGLVGIRRRLAGVGRAGVRGNAPLTGEALLVGLMAVAALAYVLDYTQAVKSTQALMLLGAAALGQGAAVWESRKQKAESRKGQRESRKQKVESKNGAGGTVLALIILLAVAAVWQAEAGHFFQYRGQARWSGPWANPNTFGMLMGAGAVLAIGLGVLSLKSKVRSPSSAEGGVRSAECEGEAGGEHPTSNIQHRTSKWGPGRSLKSKVQSLKSCAYRAFILAAGAAMGVGLVKSYSRGAWVGAAVGLTYLAYQVSKGPSRKDSNHERHEIHERQAGKAAFPVSCGSSISWLAVLRRNRVALAVICASVVVLGFWSFGHTERAVARRAYSAANANDFSWRNRVAAWEGGLQMMAEKPWFGFGWNQPERVYDQYYRVAKVNEGMAIQLNDYFMLGATLGVSALLCFAVYIGLALSGRQKTGFPAPPTLDFRLWTLDSATICRAGAVVLLVGFWFDGGLFKLPTAATFWILLELGRAGHHGINEAHENE